MSESTMSDRSDDDSDLGWGEAPAREDDGRLVDERLMDERLLDERPPHHESRD